MKDSIIKEKFQLTFKETFVEVLGFYLDKKTSFTETLETISLEQANKEYPNLDETIVSHVKHTLFYIRVLKEYVLGTFEGQADWESSWKVKKATQAEWEALKKETHKEYEDLMAFIEGTEDFSNEHVIEGYLGILAHTAYHLGAIRQLMAF